MYFKIKVRGAQLTEWFMQAAVLTVSKPIPRCDRMSKWAITAKRHEKQPSFISKQPDGE